MDFQGYLEKLCQEYMLGGGPDRLKIEEEICKVVGSSENLERVLQALSNTNDAQCTLFIGLELLTKLYLTNTKIGTNNSTLILSLEKIDVDKAELTTDTDRKMYQIFETCSQLLVNRRSSAPEYTVHLVNVDKVYLQLFGRFDQATDHQSVHEAVRKYLIGPYSVYPGPVSHLRWPHIRG